MVRVRYLLIPAVLATVLAAGAFTFFPAHHAAAAASPSHQEFIFSFVGQELPVDPCTNESVLVTSGDIKFDTDTTIDANGGINFQSVATHQDFKGIGETTGAQYEVVGTNHSGFHADGATVEDQILNATLVTAGPGNNMVLREEFHITINADGTTTVAFDHFTSDCG